MGVDYSAYVGPYVEATNSEAMLTIEKQCCTNDSCSKYKITDRMKPDDKFCSTCGSVIGPMSVSKKGQQVCEWEDVRCRWEDEDRMTTAGSEGDLRPNTVIYIANQEGYGYYLDVKYNCKLIDMGEIDTVKEIRRFEGNYADEIAVIRDAYGEENVKIKYGAMNWMH